MMYKSHVIHWLLLKLVLLITYIIASEDISQFVECHMSNDGIVP